MCQILSFLPQTKLGFEVKHTGGVFKISRVRIQVLLPPCMECGLRFCLKLKCQDRALTVGNSEFSSSFLPSDVLTCHTVPGSFYFQFTLAVNLPIKVMDSGKARKARSPNIKHAVKEKRKTVLFGLVQV